MENSQLEQLAAKILELEKGNSKISMHLYGRRAVHCNANCSEVSKWRVVRRPVVHLKSYLYSYSNPLSIWKLQFYRINTLKVKPIVNLVNVNDYDSKFCIYNFIFVVQKPLIVWKMRTRNLIMRDAVHSPYNQILQIQIHTSDTTCTMKHVRMLTMLTRFYQNCHFNCN